MKNPPGFLLVLCCILASGCSDSEDNFDELQVAGKWRYTQTRDIMSGEHKDGGGNRSFLKFTTDCKLEYYNGSGASVGRVNIRMNQSEIVRYGKYVTGEKWELSSRYYFKQDTLVIRDIGLEVTDNYYVRTK